MAEAKKTTENAPIKASTVDHPKGVVDLKIDKIATKNVATPKGLVAAETALGAISNDADQEGGVEV
jgi:hypothetical protein